MKRGSDPIRGVDSLAKRDSTPPSHRPLLVVAGKRERGSMGLDVRPLVTWWGLGGEPGAPSKGRKGQRDKEREKGRKKGTKGEREKGARQTRMI